MLEVMKPRLPSEVQKDSEIELLMGMQFVSMNLIELGQQPPEGGNNVRENRSNFCYAITSSEKFTCKVLRESLTASTGI